LNYWSFIVQIETCKLEGEPLNWAVAQCEKEDVVFDGDVLRYAPAQFSDEGIYSPSTDWNIGGPIMDRNDIIFRKYHKPESASHGKCFARISRESDSTMFWVKEQCQTGPTILIATMRCRVATALGAVVDVPDFLFK
jgi:hypothetical protein